MGNVRLDSLISTYMADKIDRHNRLIQWLSDHLVFYEKAGMSLKVLRDIYNEDNPRSSLFTFEWVEKMLKDSNPTIYLTSIAIRGCKLNHDITIYNYENPVDEKIHYTHKHKEEL